jgi:hypothetical protein
MSLISRSRKQTAVWWSQGSRAADLHGNPQVVAPVEIQCRWDDVLKEFLAADGTNRMSKAEVIVDRVMKPGDFLMLGTLANVTNAGVPKSNPGTYEVRRFDTNPNLRASENLYTAFL